MSGYTEDGACIPSWLGAETAYDAGSAAYSLNFNNSSMHKGYVVGVHYPLDAGYEQATEITYDVACNVSMGVDASFWHVYRNVKLGVKFGGSSQDFMRFSLRAPKSNYDASTGLTEQQIAECSCVLIECENGQSERAYITGFWEHPNLQPDQKEFGHNYRWDFNGMSTTISKDGEYGLTFTGAILDPNTNSYIQPPSGTTGTFFKFLKDGSWLVDNVQGESIKLDKPGKALTAVSRAMNLTTTAGDLSINTKGKTNVQASGNAVFNSKAKVYTGREGATDPHVLGNKLVQAFQELVAILSLEVSGMAGPFPCISAFPPLLASWAAKYAVPVVSPFLSRKGFVE
jgi:hypothetical protein